MPTESADHSQARNSVYCGNMHANIRNFALHMAKFAGDATKNPILSWSASPNWQAKCIAGLKSVS